MVMRVGGIVSGMDIEAMVNKLMEAERMPLQRMKQEETRLTWKRDAFREINSVLLELDQMMLDMKLTRTYQPKTATSSLESAVRATAAATATNGSYEISVSSLATNEMQVSRKLEDNINLSTKISEINGDLAGEHTFITYDEDGQPQTHTLVIKEDETLEQVLRNIHVASDGNVRAFFDDNTKQVVLETTRTGIYNTNQNGNEIEFVVSGEERPNFFTNYLNLDVTSEATNAVFKYNNGLDLHSRDNSYSLNGITFEFLNTTDGANARVTVSSDIDTSYDTIKKFVDKYNEAIDKMNKSQTEQRYRDYHPLSEEEKSEMTDKQIELWEERAKSGILRGESSIRDSMYALRNSLQGFVRNGGDFSLLSEIGIKTSENYMDGGKLVIDEDKLKAALRDNPEGVHQLFAGEDGLIHRFEQALDDSRARIERQAGKETTVALDNYTIGKRIKELNERISDFEQRMVRVEQRYWNQFTAMEKAISQLNQQSSYLFSQFGTM